jgi:hypothetical protein
MTDHSLWKPSRAVKDAIDSGNKKASSSQRKRKSRDNDFDNPCANQVYESFLVSVNAPVSEHGMTLIELTSAALELFLPKQEGEICRQHVIRGRNVMRQKIRECAKQRNHDLQKSRTADAEATKIAEKTKDMIKQIRPIAEVRLSKKKKFKYSQKDVSRLAHKLGLPGHISHKVIADKLITVLGWESDIGWRAALKRYFRESPSITGIDSYIPVQRESKGSKEGVPFEATDAFLQSYEWRKLRMEAIKKYGARCQCCGSTPKEGISINVDHIKPRRKHPELALDINNLQILCGPCNHGKGNWDMTDWR